MNNEEFEQFIKILQQLKDEADKKIQYVPAEAINNLFKRLAEADKESQI